MSENNENKASQMKQNIQMNSKNEIIEALRSKFATSVNKVYINSIDQEVGFREITVAEQKTLSRIMLDNEQRRDIIYDSQCAIINKTCLNDGFDIYELSEFDKLKLQIAMYQGNVSKTDVNFTCEECGTENLYKMDFQKTMKSLDAMDVKDREFKLSNRLGDFTFVLGYPKCIRVSQLFKNLVLKYRKTLKESGTETNMNMDYIMLFIKSMDLDRRDGSEGMHVDFEKLSPTDVPEIIEALPQDIIYSENGIVRYITVNLIQAINDKFEKHACIQCGHVQSNVNVDNTEAFFT